MRRSLNLTLLTLQRLVYLIPWHKPLYTQFMPTRFCAVSLFIRHVDGGSSNAAEQEITALFLNPSYNPDRFGIQLVTSPRQADILLLTGPLTRAMCEPLLAAFRIMPEGSQVVTVGDGFDPENVFTRSYAVIPLPDEIAARVVAHIPGNPPEPRTILETLLTLQVRDRQI